MRIVCDSSGCCGIKHIRDFPDHPEFDTHVNKFNRGHDEDILTTEPDAYADWVIAEGKDISEIRTGGDYLKFLVAQIKDRRPAGMITANLVHTEFCGDCDCDCGECDSGEMPGLAHRWRDTLLGLGFKETLFRNSNSGSLISHFTLTYDEE